jgi:hypothetical protein
MPRAGEAPPGELREPGAGLVAVIAAGFNPWRLVDDAWFTVDGVARNQTPAPTQ